MTSEKLAQYSCYDFGHTLNGYLLTLLSCLLLVVEASMASITATLHQGENQKVKKLMLDIICVD